MPVTVNKNNGNKPRKEKKPTVLPKAKSWPISQGCVNKHRVLPQAGSFAACGWGAEGRGLGGITVGGMVLPLVVQESYPRHLCPGSAIERGWAKNPPICLPLLWYHFLVNLECEVFASLVYTKIQRGFYLSLALNSYNCAKKGAQTWKRSTSALWETKQKGKKKKKNSHRHQLWTCHLSTVARFAERTTFTKVTQQAKK